MEGPETCYCFAGRMAGKSTIYRGSLSCVFKILYICTSLIVIQEMQVSDDTICSLLQKRDIKGLEYLFDNHYRSLVLWADTFLNNMQVSEDLVQDFFIRLWEKELYKKLMPGKIKTFLYTSVRNLSLNLVRKQDPLKKACNIDILDKNWEEFDEQKEQLLNIVEREIEKLPGRSREVVTAVYLKGMRYREVASTYGISEATVKTLLVLSMKRLRENLNAGKIILFSFFAGKFR